MLVVKRDGKSVLFDKTKIYKAIISSATHIDKSIDVGVATAKVEEKLVEIGRAHV